MAERRKQLLNQTVAILASLNVSERVTEARLLENVLKDARVDLSNAATVNPLDDLCGELSNATLLLRVNRPRDLVNELLDLCEVFLEISRSSFVSLF